MKANSSALGFIPASSLKRYWLHRDLWVPVHVSGVGLRGYLLHGPPRAARPLRIHQAVVDIDHRLRHHAERAVRKLLALADQHGATALQLRCRDDLDACRFWEAIGFHQVAEEPGGKYRGRLIRIYRIDLQAPPSPSRRAEPALPPDLLGLTP